MRVRAALLASALALITVSTGSGLAAAAPSALVAAAAPTRACAAAVSNARPVQGATVVVTVRNVAAGATVATSAKYKTTTTKQPAVRATSTGVATVPIKIGKPTHGFKVVVSVTGAKGATRWACSTSFTTR